MKKTTRRGEKAERWWFEVLREVLPDLAPTSNSGAKFGNGDMGTPALLVDVKSTEGSGFSRISGTDWKKISKQAAGLYKDFIIPLANKDGEYAIIFPLALGIEALRLLYPGASKEEEEDVEGRDSTSI